MARLRPAIFEQRIDMYEAVGQLMRVKVSKPLLLCVYQISRVRYRTRLYGRRSTPGHSLKNKACVRYDPIVSWAISRRRTTPGKPSQSSMKSSLIRKTPSSSFSASSRSSVISASPIIYWSNFPHTSSGTARIAFNSSSTVWISKTLPSCKDLYSKIANVVLRMKAPVASLSCLRRAEHSLTLLPLNGELGELASNLSPAWWGTVCLKVKLSTKTTQLLGAPMSSSLACRNRAFAFWGVSSLFRVIVGAHKIFLPQHWCLLHSRLP